MIHVTLMQEGRLVRGGPELLDVPGPKWVDVEDTTAEELAPLASRFGLHRLAVEDVLHLDQRPKVEEYPNHVFIVLQGFSSEGDVAAPVLHELHFFLGPDWLISAHALPSPALQAARGRMQAEPQGTFQRGMDFVLYMLADALVDQAFPLLDAFGEELEGLETAIFENPRPEHLQRIFQLKRALVQLRRVLSPQRDAASLLSRRGLSHVQERTTLYFRDVHDHLVRVQEQIDSARDVLGNAMDVYLSMLANRTNDITKQLTIFATIFLPLSFIVGFFGQNFERLSAEVYFWVMLATMVLVPGGLFFYFRRKHWL